MLSLLSLCSNGDSGGAEVMPSWQTGMVMAVDCNLWILMLELEATTAEVAMVSRAKRAVTVAGKTGKSTARY